ncbi:MAG: DUF1015 domain-containing protein [Lachnospiraceae bacterium]|nr:DUF1015 domain-containing protein [Candidatus Colinaster equi]
MAKIRPFEAYMPAQGMEKDMAALPYDVYNRKEAKAVVEGKPYTFLRIDRAETNFSDDVDTYDECVYEKADSLLQEWIATGYYVKQDTPKYYLYREIMNGRAQTGIVAVASVADYENNIIKKHENTLAAKEADRIRHIEKTRMQTGPIFLAFRDDDTINSIIEKVCKMTPYYDFKSDDGIEHIVWLVEDADDIRAITDAFEGMNAIYIADGHHRCASACKVGAKLHTDGIEKESDFFLSVLFPESQLKILDYNRVVRDLNGYSADEFLEELEQYFDICHSDTSVSPTCKGEFGMYLEDNWYVLKLKTEWLNDDPVDGLDVSLLQKYVLGGMLDIDDPKNNNRIDFVGGIRGLSELERRCHEDCKVAFSMYPTDIKELFAVADAGRLMPPKSTWFEPKLRSGLFLHDIR